MTGVETGAGAINECPPLPSPVLHLHHRRRVVGPVGQSFQQRQRHMPLARTTSQIDQLSFPVLLLSARNDAQSVIAQRPSQRPCFRPWGASQTSRSSSVVRIAGIACGCTVATPAFGSVVRKRNRSAVTSPSLTFRTDVQRVQTPVKKASGQSSSSANQIGCREPGDARPRKSQRTAPGSGSRPPPSGASGAS